MDEKLMDQLDNALHDIFRAMNLDRLPVQREGEGFSIKNMSLMETRILRNIDERGQISLKDIRAAVEIPNSSLTSIIKKFENKRLINRVIDPDDRRSFLLSTTERGHRVIEEHRLVDLSIAKAFMERVGDEKKIRDFIDITSAATREPLFSISELYNYHVCFPEEEDKK